MGTNSRLMNFPVLIKSLEIEILYALCMCPIDELSQVASLVEDTGNGSSIGRASRWPSSLTNHNPFMRKSLLDLCIGLIEEAYGRINRYPLPERIDMNGNEIDILRQITMSYPL